ncbi:MAG: 50S ribosomal protein L10 [Chloroflexaceae bacterium]|nr:50S ribosomal protein L10 [Chloroflexaceae bacterium]
MPTEQKAAVLADLTGRFSRMQLTIVSDYRGMTVAEMNEMRRKMRESGAETVVAKNTLIRMAARATNHEMLEPLLAGPTALMFAYDDVARVAKELEAYLKGNPKLTVRGGLLGASLLEADALDKVSKMPSREAVIAQILGGIQSPVAGLVSVINQPVAGVVGVVNAVATGITGVLQARIAQLQAES